MASVNIETLLNIRLDDKFILDSSAVAEVGETHRAVVRLFATVLSWSDRLLDHLKFGRIEGCRSFQDFIIIYNADSWNFILFFRLRSRRRYLWATRPMKVSVYEPNSRHEWHYLMKIPVKDVKNWQDRWE